MIVLGLNHGEINSSAALVVDGKLVAGAPEERFIRQKRTKLFPAKAIEYCLAHAGIELGDCDYVAQAWNPAAGWHKYNPLLSGPRIKREDNFYSIPDNLLNLAQRETPEWVLMDFPGGYNLPPIYHVQHHIAHAANAFFLSPFEQAAILTCDWRGEYESAIIGVGSGNSIKILKRHQIPNSLGMLYATFTELLGYRPDSDEWKVMALSAMDVDCKAITEKIRGTVRLLDDGGFEMDQSFYKGALVDQPKLYTPALVELLGGKKGIPGEEPEEWHYAVSRAMQTVAEEVACHFLKYLYNSSKCKNVVLGGGFFMNSVFNGKIIDKTDFENIYVSYAPSDVGNSIGAALYIAHCIHDEPRDFSFKSSCIGPEFSDQQIEAELKNRNINYKYFENIESQIAKLLSEGEVVATLNGKMEFGERALGNRSILADPRKADMKDRINALIKYRESYRPFAPAVLHERASKYFMVSEGYECPYMEKVVLVREEYRNLLPAITHFDGSGRVQTVKEEQNAHFYNIILEFEKLTGFPVVLNTSFNVSEEPIALSPGDAVRTFFNSGLKYLAIGQYLIKK